MDLDLFIERDVRGNVWSFFSGPFSQKFKPAEKKLCGHTWLHFVIGVLLIRAESVGSV